MRTKQKEEKGEKHLLSSPTFEQKEQFYYRECQGKVENIRIEFLHQKRYDLKKILKEFYLNDSRKILKDASIRSLVKAKLSTKALRICKCSLLEM